MNGTSAMTALAAFTLFGAEKLLRLSCVTAAFAMEIFGGIDDAFDEDLHSVKQHPGQVAVADVIRRLFAGSANITRRDLMHGAIREQANGAPVYETTINVQDVYSIRCTPQILAPVHEAVQACRRTVEIEANSSNDNPIIIPEKEKIIHGGNFHGQSIAFAMDALCMAVAELCTLSERRINKLLDKNLNEGLPEHLIPGTVGLTMGFMGAQYLATSTTAENRQLANPVGTLSISCNAENQDVVSMGTVAARKAFQVGQQRQARADAGGAGRPAGPLLPQRRRSRHGHASDLRRAVAALLGVRQPAHLPRRPGEVPAPALLEPAVRRPGGVLAGGVSGALPAVC